MQVVAKNINEYTRELKVDLTWEEVQPNFNKAAKAFSKKIKCLVSGQEESQWKGC